MNDPSTVLVIATEEELCALVTRALRRAEKLADARAPEATAAYGVVATYEEALARAFPAESVRGAFARVGAVTAALRALDVPRAQALAGRFLSEPDLGAERRREIEHALAGHVAPAPAS